jgi:hypothetical protein
MNECEMHGEVGVCSQCVYEEWSADQDLNRAYYIDIKRVHGDYPVFIGSTASTFGFGATGMHMSQNQPVHAAHQKDYEQGARYDFHLMREGTGFRKWGD